MPRFLFIFLMLFAVSLRAETMLQYFNTSWAEITAKMPELAEAGYTSLWLPPPTKGSGGLSVGYDMWDPFDLGSKNQRNSVRTRYGTEAELLRLVETAHRFGIRVYFDNIMNHRAFDVPGYNENTPIDIYPGMVPEDFHLRKTQDGFYRKWDNTRSWSDAWQVQNLGLADLIDIAQEPGTTNNNFGLTEGSTAPKIKFIRDLTRPEQYCYLPNGTYVGFGAGNGITTEFLQANSGYYSERVEDYLNRAARWLIDRTKADGLRLDAVKHVRADFYGATFGADKDTSDYGYTGQVQRQFNISRGFSDPNHRDTVFSTDAGRDDAMMFGEHLGEPPAYGPYIDSGMRLVDNDLRSQLNSRLGNPSSGLQGYDWAGVGGFAANIGVTLSEFAREAIIGDLLGRGSLPERPEIMGQPTPEAAAWERGEDVPVAVVEVDDFDEVGEAELRDIAFADIEAAARAAPLVQAHLRGMEVVKVVVAKGRLVSIVVRPARA